MAGGNFGAPPKPPCSRVELTRGAPRAASASIESVSGSVDGSQLAPTSASPRPAAARSARLRAPLAVRVATASSTRRKLGSPCRGAGGKYVPPKNGSPSGVRKTVIGQPPCPVSATTASM